ncbi:MAG TPA: DinB family protein, partial [Gemmatimonadaceae bacterium]|nr:DinB family protein [Gemmatimonadaceae bacterium]
MATTAHETDLRYPVGRFDWDAAISDADYPLLIATIAETPGALRSAVAGMSRDQLETRYRPGGWTVKQVVHHVPDSHLNAYCRFKLALTEDEPTIKPYNEAAWAELVDSRRVPIEVSLE